ncbi:putative molybdenum cofactor sulfurtransferase [Dioscorea sansibarensis]
MLFLLLLFELGAAFMHLSLWKPISYCVAMILEKKNKEKDFSEFHEDSKKKKPSILAHLQEIKIREALDEASEDGSLFKSQDLGSQGIAPGKVLAQKEFLCATAEFSSLSFSSEDSIPDLQESYKRFLTIYPKFKASEKVDKLRCDEYHHLSEAGTKVCLDYCGFGLFSYLQSFQNYESSAFGLSEITAANLSNHALFGGAEDGTVEHDIKARIMNYLNIPENEYGLVFTVSRGSAFKLLASSYPFHTNKKLLTMFDHESQSVHWMAQSAKEKGAKIYNAWFRWPTLRLCSTELRRQLSSNKKRRKKDSATGLFVFPVQSRVTGAKYSYQWMALAQQNNWHVLLDAGALGPKDMDSLGLSLFRPDFIITSFYRVFGSDPTGFGCLLMKKSVMASMQNKNGSTGSGMVRIVPVFPQYLGDSLDGLDDFSVNEDEEVDGNEDVPVTDTKQGSQLPAFSGVFTSAQVCDVFETEIDQDNSSDRDGASTIFEEAESVSVGDVMKSPVSSEDELLENSLWIDLGQSPIQSENSGQLNKGDNGSPLSTLLSNGSKTKHHKLTSPRVGAKMLNNPVYNDRVFSFDAVVLSASQELLKCKRNCCMEIEEDVEFTNSIIGHQNGSESVMEMKESAIRRETESDFRLLGRRDVNRRFYGIEENDCLASMSRRVSFILEDNKPTGRLSRNSDAGKLVDNNCLSDGDDDDDSEEWNRKEPEIVCRHLDHVNLMGLNKTTLRLRYLVNWLVTSLLQLHLRDSEGKNGLPLVHIYGPKIKYERGAAVAFNIKDKNRMVINPEIVQRLAEKDGIALGISFLSHIRIMENNGKQLNGAVDIGENVWCRPIKNGRHETKHAVIRVEVVTVSLGFLTNFEDVYRMWAFVAKFLDPAFVETVGLSCVLETSEI